MTVGTKVRGTLTTLQSIEATLTSLAVKTTEEEAKKAFHDSALKVQAVIVEVENRLKQIEIEEPQFEQT